MDMIYFLRFYTAFAEDKPAPQPTGEVEAQTAQKKPFADAFFIASCEDISKSIS